MKKEFKFGTDLDGKAKEELIRLAYEGKERSYSPYSGFQVGAALLAENGTVYLGCNIENAAYSATNCAERTAFFQAVSEGVKEFRAIAIVGGPKGSKKGELCAPCGVCRQVMMEFCDPKEFQRNIPKLMISKSRNCTDSCFSYTQTSHIKNTSSAIAKYLN